MELTFRKDETNGDWIGELTELTEPECDVARNRSVGSTATANGAVGWGVSYDRTTDTYSAHVRATEKETAENAAREYYTAIKNACPK